MVKDIPETALGFYSKEHLGLRVLRTQLEKAVGAPTVDLSSLSELEMILALEAFESIAEQGREILVTCDEKVYTQDLEKMGEGDETVYLLCDEEGNLQDMTPLLLFVPEERRREYEGLRESYLSSE